MNGATPIENYGTADFVESQKSSSIATIKRGEFDEVKKDLKDTRADVAISKKDVERTDKMMYFVVIFFAVNFVVAVVSLYLNTIQSGNSDRDLYLQYNELYKDFFDQNFELKSQVYEQKIEINNLRNEIELLRTKNYLK